jgi:hypothetical protein
VIHLYGMRLVANQFLTVDVPYDRRVRGGYLNRWLIREAGIERRPSPTAIVDRISGTIFAHPETLQRLLAAAK